MKQFFNKYLFPVCTALNTWTAISSLVTLFSPAATPATAVAVIFFGAISLFGWLTIAIDWQMAKYEKARINKVS